MRIGPSQPRRDVPGPEPLQLAVDPMRTWVNDGKGGRVRPVMCVVVGGRTGLCLGMEIGQTDQAAFELAGRLLAKTLHTPRPAGAEVRVQVRDPELATVLRRRDDLAAVHFEVVGRLQAVDELLSAMEADLFPQRVPSPLGPSDVSVDRLRAFAEACVAFYAARPWRQLHDDDVVEVEQPKAPAGMRFASVLGAGGTVAGIGFYKDAKGYERLLEQADAGKPMGKSLRWALMFHDPDELLPEDADLWQEHGLPVSPDDSVPLLMRYRGMNPDQRPDAATLAFAEGFCRALAATSEAEYDAGRWEKTVDTFDGPVTYRLAIPHLLHGAAAGAARVGGARAGDPGAHPTERATQLCYESQGQHSRRELQMLREALRLNPDCADAYYLLARRESDPAQAEPLYREAVEAGRRALGDEPFAVPDYPFWLAIESRPFMRAMAGLAGSLDAQDRLDESIEVLAEILRLNPNDNQGVRYRYMTLLVMTGRLDAARKLLESDYPGDACAAWDYATALVAFKQGRRGDADVALARAMSRNPVAVELLLDPTLVPPGPRGTWSPGDETEAVMVADLLGEPWGGDAKALRWLEEASSAPRPKPPARKRRK